MSNLSDIGFPARTEQEVNKVIMDILQNLEELEVAPHGFYYRFTDESGAQIYLQTNSNKEIIGFNPAFQGVTKRDATGFEAIERDTSPLDGAFKCTSKDESGAAGYPFVFDVPDFRAQESQGLSDVFEIGLTAFASSDFVLIGSGSDVRKSFIPSGLFDFADPAAPAEKDNPQAHAIITAEIRSFSKTTNRFTNGEFFHFEVETIGGPLDVVADAALIKSEPEIGSYVKGSFWLSGKVL